MPDYLDASGRAVWSDRPLTDAELAAHGLRRDGILQPGESFRIPVTLMDSAIPADVLAASTKALAEGSPTMHRQVHIYDAAELQRLADAADAALGKSIADLNAWRENVPAAPGRVADAASQDAALDKSIADLNSWRTGAQ